MSKITKRFALAMISSAMLLLAWILMGCNTNFSEKTEETSEGTVSDTVANGDIALSEIPDYQKFYSALTENFDSYFDEYEGEDSQVKRRGSAGEARIMVPDLSDIFYLKAGEEIEPEEAAKRLTAIMLESINEIPAEQRDFTLKAYNIYEIKCYDSETVAEVSDMLNNGIPDGYEGIRLPENTWVFKTNYTFDYTGKTFFSAREDCEAKGLIAEDGYVRNVNEGMPCDSYYILMRQGNVWRMEKLPSMLSYITVSNEG